MAPAAERAGGEHFALDLVAGLGEDLHLNRAVVHQHDVIHVDVVDKILVIHVHRMLLQIALAADGEGEFLAGLQIERHTEVAGADRRPLRVHHDADELPACRGGGADVFDHAAHPIVRRVRHVEAEDVDPGVDEFADHFRRIRGRTQRGNDFGSANTSPLHAQKHTGMRRD